MASMSHQLEVFRLLDLPLECVRFVIVAAIEPEFTYFDDKLQQTFVTVKLHSFIKLRRVCKLLDREVMHCITSRELLRPEIWHDPWTCNVCPFPRHDWSSFTAAYLVNRPHKQHPWNSNISALVNRVVDEVLKLSGLQPSASERYSYLTVLCREFKRPYISYEGPLLRRHGMIPWLFPESSPITTHSLDFYVGLALIFLRKTEVARQHLSSWTQYDFSHSDVIFGSPSEAAQKTGQAELRSVLTLATSYEAWLDSKKEGM